jgi:hypothetical protein
MAIMDLPTDKTIEARKIDPMEMEVQTAAASFKPGYHFYMAFSSLALLAMMASLDGTSVSVALPVRPLLPFFTSSLLYPLSSHNEIILHCPTTFYTSLTLA